MKVEVFLLIVGFTAILAQIDDLTANFDEELQTFCVEDDFGNFLSDDNINELDEQAISMIAQSIIRAGRPNCLNHNNWSRKFRHNWYLTKYWVCIRLRVELKECAAPRLFQPSLEECVWPWNWRWESIRRNDGTSTPTDTTDPTIPIGPTTNHNTQPNPWDPVLQPV